MKQVFFNIDFWEVKCGRGGSQEKHKARQMRLESANEKKLNNFDL